jgi:hypothetical protein
MITLFYSLTIIFFWMEIYYLYNKPNLDTIIKNKDVQGTSMKDILYYVSRLFFYAWLVVGLWSSQSELFIFLTSLHLLRFPFYHLSRRLYIIWDNILPSVSFIFMIIILVYKIKG